MPELEQFKMTIALDRSWLKTLLFILNVFGIIPIRGIMAYDAHGCYALRDRSRPVSRTMLTSRCMVVHQRLQQGRQRRCLDLCRHFRGCMEFAPLKVSTIDQ